MLYFCCLSVFFLFLIDKKRKATERQQKGNRKDNRKAIQRQKKGNTKPAETIPLILAKNYRKNKGEKKVLNLPSIAVRLRL